MSQPVNSRYRHRFPPEVIAYAVWLYFRFPLSLRMERRIRINRRGDGRGS